MDKFIVEIGSGADFHGQSATQASIKAAKDAISRSCLCGLSSFLEDNGKSKIYIRANLSVTRPEEVDTEAVKAIFPVGEVEVFVFRGGLRIGGLFIPDFGDRDESIEVALAAIEVYVKN